MSDKRPADYPIYKGKAALRFTLKPGEALPITSGDGQSSYLATKPGDMFIQLAKALGEKKYDWANKVTLGLNVTEVAKVIRAMQGYGGEFFHDPNLGSPQQGKETKQLRFGTPMENGTVFCNLTVTHNGKEEKYPVVPISPEEAKAVEELCRVAISRILGWD